MHPLECPCSGTVGSSSSKRSRRGDWRTLPHGNVARRDPGSLNLRRRLEAPRWEEGQDEEGVAAAERRPP